MTPSKVVTMNAEFLAKVDEKLRRYAKEQASEKLEGSPSDTIKNVTATDKSTSQGEQEEGDQEWMQPGLTEA